MKLKTLTFSIFIFVLPASAQDVATLRTMFVPITDAIQNSTKNPVFR